MHSRGAVPALYMQLVGLERFFRSQTSLITIKSIITDTRKCWCASWLQCSMQLQVGWLPLFFFFLVSSTSSASSFVSAPAVAAAPLAASLSLACLPRILFALALSAVAAAA